MPVRMFFLMERHIARVRAESDLRSLAIQASSFGGEQAQKIHEVLVAEQGEVYQVARESVVQAEAGALDKLRSLM